MFKEACIESPRIKIGESNHREPGPHSYWTGMQEDLDPSGKQLLCLGSTSRSEAAILNSDLFQDTAETAFRNARNTGKLPGDDVMVDNKFLYSVDRPIIECTIYTHNPDKFNAYVAAAKSLNLTKTNTLPRGYSPIPQGQPA